MELRSWFLSFLVPVLLFVATPSPAQELDPTYCVLLPDSVALFPDGIAAKVHPFGSNPIAYPNEFDPGSTILSKAFSQVFRLYLTDSVSSRWSRTEWEGIITAVMNNDTTTTDDDVFGRVWGYFVRDEKDLNPYYAGVRYVADNETFITIDLYLYDASDIPCPCTSEYGVACSGYSQYLGKNSLLINANDFVCPPSGMDCAKCAPITLEDMLGMGIAHELQHLCNRANAPQGGYEGINETLSTLAEYFMDVWRPLAFDLPY